MSTLHASRRRSAHTTLATAALLLAFQAPAFAAQRTWNGGGTDNLISNSANWIGGVAPISGADILRFEGDVRTSPQLSGDYTSFGPNSLAFANSTSSYTLGGTGTLTLNTNSATTSNAVTTNIAGAATVIDVNLVITNTNATPGAAQITNNAQASSITFNGSVNYGATTLFLSGTNAASALTFASLTGSSVITVNNAGSTTIQDATGMTNATVSSFNNGTTTFGSDKGAGGISLAGGQASTVRLLNGVNFSRTVLIAPTANSIKTLALDTGTASFTNTVNNNSAFTTKLALHAGDAASTLFFDGVISGARPIEKTGAGTVILRAANTFTGDLIVTEGVLKLGAASNRIADSVAISIGNATLDLNNLNDTVGTLDVTGAATVFLGGGVNPNTIAFADSSAIDWSGGTLSITGSFVSGSSIRFGEDATGLTSTQLGLINIPGFTDLGLNSSGFLTGVSAIPEPASAAALLGLGMLGFAATRRRR